MGYFISRAAQYFGSGSADEKGREPFLLHEDLNEGSLFVQELGVLGRRKRKGCGCTDENAGTAAKIDFFSLIHPGCPLQLIEGRFLEEEPRGDRGFALGQQVDRKVPVNKRNQIFLCAMLSHLFYSRSVTYKNHVSRSITNTSPYQSLDATLMFT